MIQPSHRLHLERNLLLDTDQTVRVHETAKGILQRVGMEVLNDPVLETLKRNGFRASGRRVFFEPHVVEEFVTEMRSQLAAQPPPPPMPEGEPFHLSVNSYSLFVHDPDTDQVLPYTTPMLVEMTKLMDTLASDGVDNTPPGFPTDEPAVLQPVAQYRIAALHARQGVTPVDPTSVETLDYLLEMANVMGSPVRRLSVWVPTPLRLGGDSLEVVLACQDQLESISVGSMPSAGVSAPLQPFGALAMGAAELIGAMIAVQTVTGKPTFFHVPLYAFDLRAGAMVFGSPEAFLYSILSSEMNRFYGYAWNPAPGSMMVMAKRPDQQAAAEKMAIMLPGALMGVRSFHWAGTLSLDEIFSPIQLLVDCEIRDWVQRLSQGVWLGEEAVDDWVEEVRIGIEQGFMALDSTLDHHKKLFWYPKRFERRAIGGWLEEGQPHLTERLRSEVKRRIASHQFELDPVKREAIEHIYQAARRKVCG